MIKYPACMMIIASLAFAGGPINRDVNGAPIGLSPHLAHTYRVETGDLNSKWPNSEIRVLVAEAFDQWNQVPGSSLQVNEGSLIERDVQELSDAFSLQAEGSHLVLFDENGAILSLFNLDPSLPGLALPSGYNGEYYTQFIIVLNGPLLEDYSESQLKAALLQITGRAIGLGFSNVNGDLVSQNQPHGGQTAPAASVEAMHPGMGDGQLKQDDISGLLSLYGESPQGAPGLGALSGRVLKSDGVTPAPGVNVVARSLAGDQTFFTRAASAITHPTTGRFSNEALPPGSYTLEVADAALHNGAVFSDPISTNAANIPQKLGTFGELSPKVLGTFPGEPEFYNGDREGADPNRDEPDQWTPVQVNADQTTSNLEMVFNRDPQKPFTQLMYPWISNRDGLFESLLIANNLGDQELTVVLTAVRNADERETVTRVIPARGFLRESAATLFPELGSGPGYAVLLSAPSNQVRGRWVTQGLLSKSGASPSQGVAVQVSQNGEAPNERSGRNMIFGYLPHGERLISAPVLVNLGSETAEVTLNFYNKQGEPAGRIQENLAPGVPFTRVIADLLPGNNEDLYMTAQSNGPLITGVSFVFDQTFFETAIGNARAMVQTDTGPQGLMFPWISNRAGQFESIVVVNNYSPETLNVELIARRRDGQSETRSVTIESNGFLAGKASELFPKLGSGPGYAVELNVPSSMVSGQWVTYNLAAASGRSPSVGAPSQIPSEEPSNAVAWGGDLLLGYMPSNGSLTSAAVLVNLGTEPVDVTLRFYNARGRLVLENRSLAAGIKPGEPVVVQAETTIEGEDLSLVASSSQPITGVVFAFDNQFFEPAIGNGSAVNGPPQTTAYAFVNVNVIPMDAEQVLTDQTVVVRDHLITDVGPADTIQIPQDAVVVDGAGKYLMPGMTDTHTHMSEKADLIMNLANGVTSVFNMGDRSYQTPRLKELVKSGEVPGPTIYAAMFVRRQGETHLTPTDEDQVRTLVRDAKAGGYSFIKAYETTQSIFDVLVDEATALGMPVTGHIPSDVDLEYILANGQSLVAHAEEYWNDYFDLTINYARIPEARRITLDHGAAVTTTLSTMEAILFYGSLNLQGYQGLLTRPGVEYMNPRRIDSWNVRFYTGGNGLSLPAFNFMNAMMKDFTDNQAPVLLGTDAPLIPGMVSGFAMHEELRVLAEAGWRPYQILRAATAAAGQYVENHMPDAQCFGTVTTGSRADLILLNANPLEDTVHVNNRAGVMAQGRWYTEQQLLQMLENLTYPQ